MNCVNCGQPIDNNRLEALAFLEKHPHEYTCIKCAPNNKLKGLYESGRLILTNNIGESGIHKDFSIQTVFDT